MQTVVLVSQFYNQCHTKIRIGDSLILATFKCDVAQIVTALELLYQIYQHDQLSGKLYG